MTFVATFLPVLKSHPSYWRTEDSKEYMVSANDYLEDVREHFEKINEDSNINRVLKEEYDEILKYVSEKKLSEIVLGRV